MTIQNNRPRVSSHLMRKDAWIPPKNYRLEHNDLSDFSWGIHRPKETIDAIQFEKYLAKSYHRLNCPQSDVPNFVSEYQTTWTACEFLLNDDNKAQVGHLQR